MTQNERQDPEKGVSPMVSQQPILAKTAVCPDCGEQVPLGLLAKMGQRVTCPHCQADLEVVETVPLELDWFYEEPPEQDDEDW
jgi:lysine biosynthesis protein LysW